MPTAQQVGGLLVAAQVEALFVLQTSGPWVAAQPVHQVVAALVLLVVLQTAGPWVAVPTAQQVGGLLVAVLVAR